MNLYGQLTYWNERYKLEKGNPPFDWYLRYTDLKHLLNPIHPNKSINVLNIGCGSSTLPEELLKDGYADKVVNIDYSNVVIDQMKEKYSTTNDKLDFMCVDITKEVQCHFGESKFDLIICKATLDSILCSSNAEYNVKKMVEHCYVLLHGNSGILVVISYDDGRRKYFDESHWKVDLRRVPKLSHEIDGLDDNEYYYVYICNKKE